MPPSDKRDNSVVDRETVKNICAASYLAEYSVSFFKSASFGNATLCLLFNDQIAFYLLSLLSFLFILSLTMCSFDGNGLSMD